MSNQPVRDLGCGKSRRLGTVLGLSGLFLGGTASAQLFHIGIDVSNPSAVAFTSIALTPALANDSSMDSFDGVTLTHFFTGVIPTSARTGAVFGNLTPRGVSVSYDGWASNDMSTPGSYEDLNLYNSFGSLLGEFQEFSTAAVPFLGQATLNLRLFAGHLPGYGASGEIRAGYSENPGPVIAVWRVTYVPETGAMGQFAVFGAACGLAVAARRRGRG